MNLGDNTTGIDYDNTNHNQSITHIVNFNKIIIHFNMGWFSLYDSSQ